MTTNDFKAWADGYFAPETNRLNSFIPKVNLLKDFNISTGFSFGMLRFTGYLKEWAQQYGFVYNPSEFTDHHGRIVRTLNEVKDQNRGMTVEMIYIQTHQKKQDETQYGVLEVKDGLTLRDQFAMAALPALISAHLDFAKKAYEVADKMLEIRKQEGWQK